MLAVVVFQLIFFSIDCLFRLLRKYVLLHLEPGLALDVCERL